MFNRVHTNPFTSSIRLFSFRAQNSTSEVLKMVLNRKDSTESPSRSSFLAETSQLNRIDERLELFRKQRVSRSTQRASFSRTMVDSRAVTSLFNNMVISSPELLARTGYGIRMIDALCHYHLSLRPDLLNDVARWTELDELIDAIRRFTTRLPAMGDQIFALSSWTELAFRLVGHPCIFRNVCILLTVLSNHHRLSGGVHSGRDSMFWRGRFRLDRAPVRVVGLVYAAPPTIMSKVAYLIHTACTEEPLADNATAVMRALSRGHAYPRIGTELYNTNFGVLVPVLPVLAGKLVALLTLFVRTVPTDLTVQLATNDRLLATMGDLVFGFSDWGTMLDGTRPESILANVALRQDHINVIQSISVLLYIYSPFISPLVFIDAGIIPVLHKTLLQLEWETIYHVQDATSKTFSVLMTACRCLYFLCDRCIPGTLDTSPFYLPSELQAMGRPVRRDHGRVGCTDGPLGLIPLMFTRFVDVGDSVPAFPHVANFVTMVCRSSCWPDQIIFARCGGVRHLIDDMIGPSPQSDAQSLQIKFDMLASCLWDCPAIVRYIDRSIDPGTVDRIITMAIDDIVSGTVLLRNLAFVAICHPEARGRVTDLVMDKLPDIVCRSFAAVPLDEVRQDNGVAFNTALLLLLYLWKGDRLGEVRELRPSIAKKVRYWHRLTTRRWRDQCSIEGTARVAGWAMRDVFELIKVIVVDPAFQ